MAKRIVFTDVKTYEVIVPVSDKDALAIIEAWQRWGTPEEQEDDDIEGSVIHEVVNMWSPYADEWEYVGDWNDRIDIVSVEDVPDKDDEEDKQHAHETDRSRGSHP